MNFKKCVVFISPPPHLLKKVIIQRDWRHPKIRVKRFDEYPLYQEMKIIKSLRNCDFFFGKVKSKYLFSIVQCPLLESQQEGYAAMV